MLYDYFKAFDMIRDKGFCLESCRERKKIKNLKIRFQKIKSGKAEN